MLAQNELLWPLLGRKISFLLPPTNFNNWGLRIKLIKDRLTRGKKCVIRYLHAGVSQRNKTQGSSQMIEIYIPS